MINLDKSGNAVFSLYYHFISVIKYRQKIFINNEIIDDLKNMIKEKSKIFDVEIIEQECGIDHIHLLFKAKPSLNIPKFINALKGHTSRKLRSKYKLFLKDKLWGDNLWSPSYFLATTGNVTIDMLKNYVDTQRALDND
jgi:putative transposase